MIYAIYGVELERIKIGMTASSFHSRLNSIQPCSAEKLEVLTTCPGGRAEEGELHKAFSAYRLHNEWFSRDLFLIVRDKLANDPEWLGNYAKDLIAFTKGVERKLSPCGTLAGARKHRTRGEVVCDICAEASKKRAILKVNR